MRLQIRLCNLEKKLGVEWQRHAERAALEAELQSSGIRVTPVKQTPVRGVKRTLAALEKSSTDKSLSMERFRLAKERFRGVVNELNRILNYVPETTI
jgi:hypothetical protein